MAYRFPFLLVDRVIELEHEKYAVGYKNVTVNDNFFPGHFPQRAIMPGERAACAHTTAPLSLYLLVYISVSSSSDAW